MSDGTPHYCCYCSTTLHQLGLNVTFIYFCLPVYCSFISVCIDRPLHPSFPPATRRKQQQQNDNEKGVEEFLINRYKRLHRNAPPPGGTAPGWDSSSSARALAIAKEALTPAETSLLKSLAARGGEAGGGVAGVAGLERLMRVMIDAPDVSLERWATQGDVEMCVFVRARVTA